MRCADGPCDRSKNFTALGAGGRAEHWNPRVFGSRDYPRIRCICEFNATIVLVDCCRRDLTRQTRQTGRVGFEKSSKAIVGGDFGVVRRKKIAVFCFSPHQSDVVRCNGRNREKFWGEIPQCGKRPLSGLAVGCSSLTAEILGSRHSSNPVRASPRGGCGRVDNDCDCPIPSRRAPSSAWITIRNRMCCSH